MKQIFRWVFLFALFAWNFAALPARVMAAQPAAPEGLTLLVDRFDDPILSPPSACTAAANDCTLRGAVITANQNPGSTIQIPVMASVPLLDYVIVITTPMTITGQSNPYAVIYNTGYPRGVFQVDPGGSLNLYYVSLRNGQGSNGGAIYNKGKVSMTNAEVFSNTVSGWGAGLFNDENATMVLSNTTIWKNTGQYGGGILNNGGIMTLTNSSVYSNTAGIASGGISNGNSFNNVGIGRMTLVNTKVMSNSAQTSGAGGIGTSGALSMSGGAVQNNRGMEGAGIGISAIDAQTDLSNVTIASNVSISGNSGGGIANRGWLTLTGGSVNTNTASGGGGLYNLGTALISGTQFLTNAASSGGGMTSLGVVTLTNGLFRANTATGGGAMALQGTAFITNAEVTQNTGSPAGIMSSANTQIYKSHIEGNSGTGISGGFGNLFVQDTVIQGNGGGGVFGAAPSGNLTFDRVQFLSNSATYGGAISGYSAFTVTNSSLVSNNAIQGGAINIFSGASMIFEDSAASFNSISGGALGGAQGGGVYNNGRFTARRSVFYGNTSSNGQGAGLFNTTNSIMNLDSSEVSNNQSTAFGGGGIANAGNLSIHASSIIFNSSQGDGAGISNTLIVSMVNSTLSNNTTTSTGGGIYNNALGGAYFYNSDILSNTASLITGTGGVASTGQVWFGNTVLAYNTGNKPDCEGFPNSLGYNILGNSTGCTLQGTSSGNQINVDPLFQYLAKNGGYSATHLPLGNSPVLNAGDPTGCINGLTGAYLTVDQRGMARPKAGRCDIGSVEGPDLIRAYVPSTQRVVAAGW
ncbi:MAG TPA: choice-of-anchor Q domain-containing protein [Thermoflexales bacterium]|nr:choice-of-anchor Q domain-containing protein [Thermoflexales bacterium]HQW35675.1 choice-of-anchor Q domain-containing protein [Thermoflexales bacterium]